jgi:hypothetical protein
MSTPEDDRRLKIEKGKRVADQAWVDQEEYDELDVEYSQEYVWQKEQWCPPGLRKSQKRRVQRLRNRELKEAATQPKKVWKPKKKLEEQEHLVDDHSVSGHSADVNMVFYLPMEFAAPAN